MKVKILNPLLAPYPFTPATQGSAGIDLRACMQGTLRLTYGQQVTIATGVAVAIPHLWVGLIAPRSGLGSKGLTLANTTGVIDSDYRGEILLKVRFMGQEPLLINPMDRVAQLVIVPHYDYSEVEVVRDLDTTLRGVSGFGSTGVAA